MIASEICTKVISQYRKILFLAVGNNSKSRLPACSAVFCVLRTSPAAQNKSPFSLRDVILHTIWERSVISLKINNSSDLYKTMLFMKPETLGFISSGIILHHNYFAKLLASRIYDLCFHCLFLSSDLAHQINMIIIFNEGY